MDAPEALRAEPKRPGGADAPSPGVDDARQAWLTLHHADGLGALRIARLTETFGGARQALAASPAQWAELGVPAHLHPSSDARPSRAPRDTPAGAAQRRPDVIRTGVARDLEWLARDDRHAIVTPDDAGYPALLRELPDPPPVLYLIGDAALLQRGQIAIVGSRSATWPGLRHARRFARELAEAGVVITSGLALGIDAEAHLGALDAPAGRTIAVMATGPDRVYPARHRRLAHRIADHGLLVALWPVGTPPRAGQFPARNRVISGLALGTLVVEAALPSGTLVTARLAMEQGRQVYALPGAIDNPVARGCHRLIRDGAMLVDTPDDILEDLANWLGVAATPGRFTTLTAPASERKPRAPADGRPGTPALRAADAARFAQTPDDRPTSLALPAEAEWLLARLGNSALHPDEIIAALGREPDPGPSPGSLTPARLSSMLALLELAGAIARTDDGRIVRLPWIATN